MTTTGKERRQKIKTAKFLTVQGSFLFDGVYPDLDEAYDPTDIGANNYTGFNLFNLSLPILMLVISEITHGILTFKKI